tara:strand:+ start:260 stop:970 length:711 start_codon:yes stop_codon:yes gene_type:complete
MIEKGLIYVLIGDKYVFTGFPHWEMCKKSVGSVKLHCPDLHVTLITESEVRDDDPGFDNVIVLEVDDKKYIHPWTYKTLGFLKSPYENTIFIDTDTRVHSDRILEIYPLLNRFDIVAVLEGDWLGHRYMSGSELDPLSKDGKYYDNIPVSFPSWNSGFVGYRKNEKTDNCWRYMIDRAKTTGDVMDERWLRKYSYVHPELLVGTLPPQFNFRAPAVFGQKHYWQNTVVEHHHGIWK